MRQQQSSSFQRFKEQLHDMFQMQRGDLDFGIYRIMNQKRDEINAFLDMQLLPQLRTTLEKHQLTNIPELKAKLEETTNQLREAGVDPSLSPKIKELRHKIAQSIDVDRLENEIYSDLYNFFKRYYHQGDFISQRRYRQGIYALPYEGEEVKLYWANHDQYYIKTSENLKNYQFKTAAGQHVRFELVAAGTEINNNKSANGKERRFILHEINPLQMSGNELTLYFEYRPDEYGAKQNEINQRTLASLFKRSEILAFGLQEKVSSEKNPNRTVLEKHLDTYTTKNTFDYFIHKDLGKFLNQELDFFIKNEIMHLDDIESESAPKVETYLVKIKALRKVARKIIQFMAQLENFQKKLWLKKKFVLETHYCITLDHIINSTMADELLSIIAANEDQCTAWVKLFAIDEVGGDLAHKAYSHPLSMDFLRENDKLPVDTRFFDADFKYKILSIFDNLDEATNGLLINSENFQALNLLQTRYKEKIKCVYIDPPYNTGNDGFSYKDSYQHSSWLTMMENRISFAHALCRDDAAMFISINDNEAANLEKLLRQSWGEEAYQTKISVKVRHENRILRADIPYQEVIEDLYIISKTNDFKPGRRDHEETSPHSDYLYEIATEKPDEIISLAGYEVHLFKMGHYQIKRNHTGQSRYLKRYTIRGSLITQKGSASEYYELNLRHRREFDGYGCLYKVLEMGKKGDGLGYRYIMQPENKGGDNGIYFQGFPIKNTDKTKPYPNFLDMEQDFNNCSDEGGVNFANGKKPLSFLEKINRIGCIDKDKEALILDYFAGSGTTGHAVINLNREDGGMRKYILVEMGSYFDTVTKPRILKAAYSKDWRDGKSVSREGISQLVKYITLEQYEDTLNNLGLARSEIQSAQLKENQAFNEQYKLSYMLDIETKGSQSLLNIDDFAAPFGYQLCITRNDETQKINIDLIETFNYLLGLNVRTIRHDKAGIVTVTGHKSTQENCLIIWRNIHAMNNDQLDQWFDDHCAAMVTEIDRVYINGDNNIENRKHKQDHWTTYLIEAEFKRLMFEGNDG